MHFQLSDSPLRNFAKYDGDNIYDLLLPFIRDFVSAQHILADAPLPPGAFVLRADECRYLNGYSFPTPEEFEAEVAIEAQTADAIITLAELGSVEKDFSRGLVMVCVQTRAFFRCRVFQLASGKSFEILENPLRITLPPDPDQDSPDDNDCYLMGIEALLRPLF